MRPPEPPHTCVVDAPSLASMSCAAGRCLPVGGHSEELAGLICPLSCAIWDDDARKGHEMGASNSETQLSSFRLLPSGMHWGCSKCPLHTKECWRRVRVRVWAVSQHRQAHRVK